MAKFVDLEASLLEIEPRIWQRLLIQSEVGGIGTLFVLARYLPNGP